MSSSDKYWAAATEVDVLAFCLASTIGLQMIVSFTLKAGILGLNV